MHTINKIAQAEHAGLSLRQYMETNINYSTNPVIIRGNNIIHSLHTKLRINDIISYDPAYNLQLFTSSIVYQNNVILVINKPYLLPSQPGKKTTVSADTLAKSYSQMHSISELKLCHRLDAITTGLLAFGKGKSNAKMIQNANVLKYYIALTHPCACDNIWRTIEPTINGGYHVNKCNESSINFSWNSRNITYAKPIKTIAGINLVLWLFCISHGLKHQLRKICAFALNAPIYGDRLYSKLYTDENEFMLHAFMLRYAAASSASIFKEANKIITAPIPEQSQEDIESLKFHSMQIRL